MEPQIINIAKCYFCLKESKSKPVDKDVCESCLRQYYTDCFQCGGTYLRDDMYSVEGYLFCQDCLDEYTYDCYSCCRSFLSDHIVFCSSCNERYCQPCYDEDACQEQNQTQDQELEFQTGKKTPLITVDRFVGVEIEAEEGERSDLRLPSTFGIKDDGSLNEETGVEIVTPPSKNGALIQNIKLVCSQLKSTGFKSTEACGLHVHIDLRDLKDNFIQLSRILRTFYAIEDVLFAMLPDSRLNNHYCIPLRHKYDFYDFYGRKISKAFDATLYGTKDKSLLRSWKQDHHNDKRYRSCNFHSVFYRGTLEVRAHSATQNPTKIFNWIELLLKITDWSIKKYSQKTVEKFLKMAATEEKVEKMQTTFKFSPKIETYIKQRIKTFKHSGLQIKYNLGTPPKSLKNSDKKGRI